MALTTMMTCWKLSWMLLLSLSSYTKWWQHFDIALSNASTLSKWIFRSNIQIFVRINDVCCGCSQQRMFIGTDMWCVMWVLNFEDFWGRSLEVESLQLDILGWIAKYFKGNISKRKILSTVAVTPPQYDATQMNENPDRHIATRFGWKPWKWCRDMRKQLGKWQTTGTT